ncbi:MAG: ferredoxin reductase family protein [Rhodospirillaceae bacterium]
MSEAQTPSLSHRLRGVPPGWWLVAALLLITTVLWGIGVLVARPASALNPWLGPSLLLSDWAIALLAVILLATTRSRSIEPLFGGLDRAVRFHRQLAPIAIGITFIHVLMYIPPALSEGRTVAHVLIPFWSENPNESLTAGVFWLLVALTAAAYNKTWRYERWLLVHGLLGPVFLMTSAHALMLGPVIQAFEPLRFWMWALVLVGAGAWIYRVLLFRRVAPHYPYKVEQATVVGDNTLDLVMRPKARRMMFEPGTFVFIRRPSGGLPGQEREAHPFSISSAPTERDLRLSIRMVGDFTKELTSLQPGDPMEVYGPFGGFTPHRYAGYRRLVCIGAGIGITPFLSMMRFELANNDFRRIWLWYVARTEDGAPYHQELSDLVLKADSYVDYDLWLTGERGRLTAKKVIEEVMLDDFAVMLCGSSKFTEDMTRQFRAAGLPEDRLIFDDLSFR